MKTQTVLTPYFLDQLLPGLESLLQPDWILNQQTLEGDLPQRRMGILHVALAGQVEKILSGGNLPVSIAGDCPAALGVWAGLSRAGLSPTLVWLDAHGDFNTWETTPSGFLGGMPLAMLAGLGEQTLLEILDVKPLPQEQIILSDARDLDPGERRLVEGSGITHLKDPLDLLDYPFPQRPIWVHFDTDIVDPGDVPAQNYPAPGGPNREELARIFQALRKTGLVRAVSLSSWAPDLPGAQQSRDVSLGLLGQLVD